MQASALSNQKEKHIGKARFIRNQAVSHENTQQSRNERQTTEPDANAKTTSLMGSPYGTRRSSVAAQPYLANNAANTSIFMSS